jgi:hypothetical protein
MNADASHIAVDDKKKPQRNANRAYLCATGWPELQRAAGGVAGIS